MAQIVLNIVDNQVDRFRQKMVDAGLLKRDDDVTRPVTVAGEKPTVKRRVPVVFFERNDSKEECLFVAGDQVGRFSGKTVRIDDRQWPVVAAVHEKGRTRVIFPVGSGVAKLTAEIELDEVNEVDEVTR